MPAVRGQVNITLALWQSCPIALSKRSVESVQPVFCAVIMIVCKQTRSEVDTTLTSGVMLSWAINPLERRLSLFESWKHPKLSEAWVSHAHSGGGGPIGEVGAKHELQYVQRS